MPTATKPAPARARRPTPPPPPPAEIRSSGGLSSYTLTYEENLWRVIKTLAAMRGQSIREFMRFISKREVLQAVRSGEMPEHMLHGVQIDDEPEKPKA